MNEFERKRLAEAIRNYRRDPYFNSDDLAGAPGNAERRPVMNQLQRELLAQAVLNYRKEPRDNLLSVPADSEMLRLFPQQRPDPSKAAARALRPPEPAPAVPGSTFDLLSRFPQPRPDPSKVEAKTLRAPSIREAEAALREAQWSMLPDDMRPNLAQKAAYGALVQPFVDAYDAVTGRMTEDEQKQFFFESILGALPGARLGGAVRGAAGGLAKGSAKAAGKRDLHVAYGTYEGQPGVGTGHLEPRAGAPAAERTAYARDPASLWSGESGKDIIYDGLGVPTLPTLRATGMYQSRGGSVEINPAAAARPLVPLAGEPGAQYVAPTSRALLNAVEATRAYLGAQNAGAWSTPIPNRMGASGSLFWPHDRAMTPEQLQAAKAVGAKHGLPDPIDYGEGGVLTKFSAPPSPRRLADALKNYGLKRELYDILPGAEPRRVQIDSGYIGFEDAWRQPMGTGAATRELRKILEDPSIPGAIKKLDANPTVRQAAMVQFEQDAELALRTGQAVREDVQLARQIVGTEGFSGLFRALDRGVALPAAIVAPILTMAQGGAQDEEPL
jgi:hypothetical protein